MLWYVAVCCSLLQLVAPRIKEVAVHACLGVCCSMLWYVAVCCSVLQCIETSSIFVGFFWKRCRVLQYVVVCCNVLQCIETSFIFRRVVFETLHCVTVRSSVLQCVAVY